MSIRAILAALAAGGAKWKLSGATISDISTSRICTAGIRFNTDGTVDKLENATYTQLSAATDYVVPNYAPGATYEVGFTALSGDAFDSAAAAEDAYVDLSAAREWYVQDTVSTPVGNKSTTCTFRIRNAASGVVVASGSYSFTAEYDAS